MMTQNGSDNYDVIIIGAGIGGLVCGCYLAKAGMKVLIVEQHYKPGGYCTSFKRHGFTFDAAAHSFGGYRYGPLGKIFKDLEIDKRLRIQKFDPSDTIVTSDYHVSFWSDLDKTISECQKSFPDERENIDRFFRFLFNPDPNSFARIRSWTFKKLLDTYLNDNRLKAIFSFPLLGNGGLPASLISAFLGAKIFKEFLLDGGYYPDGGMQELPNALSETFKQFGGELLLSHLVKRIKTKNDRVTGVIVEKNGFFPAKYVVSNCDARQTFFSLLGKKVIPGNIVNKINNMSPSLSMFIVYLGLNEPFTKWTAGVNMWFLFHYDIEEIYLASKKWNYTDSGGYMIHISADRKSLLAFLNAPFKSKRYWASNKTKIADTFIDRIERHSIPHLRKHIIYRDAATPSTLYRYTLNYRGAAYGWAGLPSQFVDLDLRRPSFIHGLYLTGHWTTQGLGIPGVTYLGYDTANLLIKRNKAKVI